MSKPILQYLERLFRDLPEEHKGAIQAQVKTAAGTLYAGAIIRDPNIEGLLLVTTVGQRPSRSGQPQPVMVTVAIDEETIVEVHTSQEMEQSRILVPHGAGQVMPAHQ